MALHNANNEPTRGEKRRITKVEVLAKTRTPSPNPKRDALQALPGTGSVKVIATTETGAEGTGEVWYVRISGGPEQLNIMACLPNALYLETGSIGPESPLKLVDGSVQIPTGAGFSW